MTASRSWAALALEERTEAAARGAVVIVPLAATEQHGPHLPLSTDVDIGLGILAHALGELPEDAPVYRLPPETVGVSPEHLSFPGTRSRTPTEMEARIVAVGSELARAGIRRLVFLNSHGGNKAVVDTAALRLRRAHGLLVVKAHYFRFPRPENVELPDAEWAHGLHGGAVETAMMLHLHPDRVRREALRDFTSLGQRLEASLRRVAPEGVAPFAWLAEDLHPEGVTGNAALATPEMGSALVTHYGSLLREVVEDALRFPLEALADAPSDPGDEARLGQGAAWRLLLALEPGGSSATDPESGATLSLASPGCAEGWETHPAPSREARELLELFLPVRAPSGVAVAQLGQSLDGRIATESGHSHYINGPEDIRRLHRLRALCDAVVVGAGTVAADDPRLTVREAPGPNPVRVVLDPRGRLPVERHLFQDGAAPTLWLVGAEAGVAAGRAGEQGPGASVHGTGAGEPSTLPGVERIPLSLDGAGRFEPKAVLELLRARGLNTVLVEGGGFTVSRFLDAGALDRMHVTVAPLLLGSGRSGLQLPVIETLDQALRPPVRHFTLGSDLLFDLDLSARG